MKTSKFDIADYLDSKEMIEAYLETVSIEGNEHDMRIALKYIENSYKK